MSFKAENNSLYHDLTIGQTRIRGNLLLAPLAGYSDAAFRSICIAHGASLCHTEMISAEAVYRGNEKTLSLLDRGRDETDYAIQMFASNPVSAASCTRKINEYNPVLIDLNCGCAVTKILKSGCGAVLLRNPHLIGEIVRAISENTSIPVTIKLRSGWDAHELSYVEASCIAVENGAKAVTLHPRTRSEGFSGHSDWSQIGKLKSLLDVPVLGSGDLFSPQDAQAMITQTECDGVMFARGAIGNPFIFNQTRAFLENVQPAQASDKQRLDTMLRHLMLMMDFKPERIACREMRKHAAHYFKGIHNAGVLRREINQAQKYSEYEDIVIRNNQE
ncbi:MAG: tRNA dihydrouridine synthase DusB [Spirochaetaceae bacterium]|nr:MAG: tRNA dihydrouridine synthase DusB [Spirochaetaceae bacterium]